MICRTPSVMWGHNVNWSPFSQWNVRNNRRCNVQLGNIGASACPMVAFSGFYESHEPPSTGDVHDIVPLHRDGHWNGHKSVYILHLCFVCCHSSSHRGNTEQVVARWQHPVASGVAMDAALGNAACTALTPLHGQRNGLRWRCIRSSSPAFLLGIIVAKDHVMVTVHLN